MRFSRMLYRAASGTNDWEVLASGCPSRIFRHYLRKALYRQFGNRMRQWLR